MKQITLFISGAMKSKFCHKLNRITCEKPFNRGDDTDRNENIKELCEVA